MDWMSEKNIKVCESMDLKWAKYGTFKTHCWQTCNYKIPFSHFATICHLKCLISTFLLHSLNVNTRCSWRILSLYLTPFSAAVLSFLSNLETCLSPFIHHKENELCIHSHSIAFFSDWFLKKGPSEICAATWKIMHTWCSLWWIKGGKQFFRGANRFSLTQRN